MIDFDDDFLWSCLASPSLLYHPIFVGDIWHVSSITVSLIINNHHKHIMLIISIALLLIIIMAMTNCCWVVLQYHHHSSSEPVALFTTGCCTFYNWHEQFQRIPTKEVYYEKEYYIDSNSYSYDPSNFILGFNPPDDIVIT